MSDGGETLPEPDRPARRLDALWARGERPDLGELLAGLTPLDPAELAEVLLVDQRRRWESGERVPAEDYLHRFPQLQAHDEHVLDLAYGEYRLRERGGEAPAAAEFVARFPRLADLFPRQLELHRAMAAPDGRASPWPSVPGYEVLGELGRGGMGVVYKAKQVALKRLVALKLIKAGDGARPGELSRFRTEAELVARLQHANIVQVHEAGEYYEGGVQTPDTPGCPYLAMEYVTGGSVRDRLDGTPWPARQAAELLEVLARAVQHAHERGVLHRDLKPGNVLLAEDGTPKVADFGLARLLAGGEATETQPGAVLGTPSYMAPEQARGRTREVGPACDVYALGAVLYECLTGRPPFTAESLLETLQLVRDEDPIPPRRLWTAVPRDLELLCLKCLRKEPERRYASAAQLAGELRRFLDGLPLRHTRPVGQIERGWLLCRRNPAVALLLTALGLSLVIGLAFSIGFAWRAEVRAGWATQRAAEAQAARERSDRSGYLAYMQLAQQHWEEGAVDQLRERLERQRPEQTGGVDLRGFEWHFWWGRLHTNLLTIRTGPGPGALACSPDGRYLIGGTVNGVSVWDATTGKEVWSVRSDLQVSGVAWTPDGKRVAGLFGGFIDLLSSAPVTGYVKVWDAATGREVRTIRSPEKYQFGKHLAFSPNGKRLAANLTGRGRPSCVALWDVDTGRELPSLPGERAIAFSPRGQHLATADGTTVRLRDAASGRVVSTLHQASNKGISWVAFDPTGTRLAGMSMDGAVRVYDADTGNELAALTEHRSSFGALAWSPDGLRLATGGLDRTVRIWSPSSGAELHRFKGHTAAVFGVAFHPDGRRLMSASLDKSIKAWDTVVGQEPLTLAGKLSLQNLAFSPDGTLLAGAFHGEQVLVWNPATGQERFRFPTGKGGATSVAFSPDGRRLVAGLNRGGCLSWDLVSGTEGQRLEGVRGGWSRVGFCPDGVRIAVASKTSGDTALRQVLGVGAPALPASLDAVVWDPRTGGQARLFPKPVTGHYRFAFNPNGGRLAAGSGSSVRLWDLATRQEVAHLTAPSGESVHGLALSPDGERVACSVGNAVRVWESATGRLLCSLKGHTSVYALAFGHDGRRVATGSSFDGTVKVWDVDGGEPILTLKGPSEEVTAVAFSPDGHRLAAGYQSGTVRVWDASPPGEDGRQQSVSAGALRYHHERATESLHFGRWAEAVTHLDFLLGKQADSVSDRKNRGRAHGELGHWEKAAADFVRALELLPDRSRSSPERAAVVREVIRWDEVYTRVAARRPDEPGLGVARGRLLIARRRWKEAAAAYALEIDGVPPPTNDEQHAEEMEYANLLLLADDEPGYRRYCRRLIERVGAKPDAFQGMVLARVCGLVPRPEAEPAQLVRWAEPATKVWASAWYRYTLGVAHARSGEWDAAEKWLLASDRAGWGNATVLNWLVLAEVHRARGESDRARAWLGKATRWLDRARPEDLPACDWLEAHALRREFEPLVPDKPAR